MASKRVLAASSLIAICAISTPALAQNEAAAGPADDEFEENRIIVTALRVEQNIQDVPIAISAIGGDDLTAKGITNPTTLGDAVPNLAIVRNNGGVQITIRGVTSTDLTEKGDPSTAFLADGIFIARPQAQEVSFFDVERVEVLRGPQGTLYGRNTTAGVLNVISARPTDEFEVSGNVAYGNFDTIQATGVVNVPVGDSLAVRAAVNYDRRDNFLIDTADDGISLDPFTENLSFRLSAALDVSDSFDIIVRADYSDIGGIANTALPLSNFFLPDDIATAAGGDIIPVLNGDSSAQRTNGFTQSNELGRDNSTWGVMAELNLDVGPGTLTYLGSYRELERDETATTLFIEPLQSTGLGTSLIGDYNQHSHELRYAYGEGGPVFIQGGFYYFREESDIVATFSDSFGFILPLPFDGTDLVFQQNPTIAEAIGLFGQATVDLTDRLKLTGGIRWTKDDKSRQGGNFISGGTIGANLGADPFQTAVNDAAVSFEEVTWRVGLDYETDIGLLYASVSTGYKAGGFNDGCLIGTQPGCGSSEDALFYDPEQLTAFEGGAKLDFADGRVRLNVGAFYYDYEDLQVNAIGLVGVPPAPATIIQNAAEASVLGLEVESQVEVSERNLFAFGLTLLDAEYDEYEPIPGVDFSGRDLDRASNVTVSAAYTYTLPLGNGGEIDFTANTKLSSEFFVTDQADAIQFRQGSFTKTGLSLTYTEPDGRWYVQGFANNLEDNVIVLNATNQFGGQVNAIGDPRTYGARVGFEF